MVSCQAGSEDIELWRLLKTEQQGAHERADGRGRGVAKKCINFVQLVFVPEMKVKTRCYFEINF